MTVMDRQELHAELTDAMLGRASEQLFGGRMRSGKVKSRIIEAHPPGHDGNGTRTLVTEVAERAGTRIEALGDELWGLLTERDVIFFDTLNSRFWLVHSMASADTVARFVKRELLTDARFDSAWFPSAQLDELEGERQWMKSSFVADDLAPTSIEGGTARRWRVQVEGDQPQELLGVIRDELPRYARATALTAVGSRIETQGIGEAQVVADYRGSFVSLGNSFDLVAGVLWRSLDRYEAFVQELESAYRLHTTSIKDIGLEVEGKIATIQFPDRVMDLSSFIAGLFSCKEPFRLWAVPREIAPGEWEANAVDLHVGQTLRIEITEGWTRILLDENTCGNTLARLVANLQHRFHAQTLLAPLSA